VAEAIVRLEALPTHALRMEWRRLHRTDPPASLSRDLLRRALAHTLQERAHGGLSQSARRALLGHAVPNPAAPDRATAAPRPMLRPGVRLVRDWHGETHSVLVLEDGFDYRGQRCHSLTGIAKTITGTHWSGPRFFGVSQPRRTSARIVPGNEAIASVGSGADHGGS